MCVAKSGGKEAIKGVVWVCMVGEWVGWMKLKLGMWGERLGEVAT